MLTGKGLFIWKISNIEGGDINAAARQLIAGGFQHVLIKIADGTEDYNVRITGGIRDDLAARLSALLKSKGIVVWGWHYVYGDNPEAEAGVAYRRILETGVSGYVINAEAHYKGKTRSAQLFGKRLKGLLETIPGFPIALSSYRYPEYHPELPWYDFLKRCDFAMPQVYWMQAHNPAYQLRATFESYNALYKKIGVNLPIIPTGSAFSEYGWTATAADITEFLDQAFSMGLTAVNFWSYRQARHVNPDLWAAIVAHKFGHPAIPPPPPLGETMTGVVVTPKLKVRIGVIPASERGFLYKDDVIKVVDLCTDKDGNTWAKIILYAAVDFSGETLIKITPPSSPE